MNPKKALIGMSGGVDSSVAALLMRQQEFSCMGVYMRLHSVPCGGANHSEDAEAVAQKMGIPFQVMDFQDAFQENVIRPFIGSYESGLVPNPCIRCNRTMKFGALLDRALEMGYHYVVTGHYARIRRDETTGRYLLYKAADRAKDQTYFLAGLSQHQLAHILFPLGQMTKEEVRALAQDNGLLTARKKDSQDICFVPDGDYVAFMERYAGKTYPAGDFLDLSGNVVGRHRGAVAYTIGQRKGLGLAMGAPVYVCGKDMQKNAVTVGPNEALFSKALRGCDWEWYPFPTLEAPIAVTAKTRHSQSEQPAVVYPEKNGFARVEFESPQRAITPGQAVVLYQDDVIIGGGTITEVL